MMLQNIVSLYWAECPKTHMQRYIGKPYALLFYLFQQLSRKMKTCCRCRSRTIILRINRLIAVLILQLVCDIRRQRHLSKLIQHLFKDPVIVKLHQTVSFFHDLKNLCLQKTVPKDNSCPRLHFLTRLYQSFPDVIFMSFQKKHLYRCPGIFLYTKQSCRKHLGIIQDKTVTRMKIICDIVKDLVLPFPGLFIHHQKP